MKGHLREFPLEFMTPFENLRGFEERSEGHIFPIWSLRENLKEVKGTPFGIEPKLTG